MVNAKLLAQVIIGGVREEISLERLMQDAQEDINQEMKKAEEEGADEQEITARVNRLLVTKNLRVRQMDNLGGATSTIAREKYSKCADMSELRTQYQAEAPPPPVVPAPRRTREAVRRAYAAGISPEAISASSDRAVLNAEEDAPPSPYSPGAAPAATAATTYSLKEDEAVSMAQTERIVQRMRHKKS
jgi:hypothetical protein